MKVSIITPVYNGEEFIERAIDSVLAQTHKDWEMIIVDDGSTDASIELAEEWQEEHPEKIKVFSLGANYGQGYARNCGFKKATGELIAYIDCDDEWKPNHLEARIKIFENNPDVDFVYGMIQAKAGDTLYEPNPTLWGDNLSGTELQALKEANITIPSTVMHSPKPFDLLGGFPEGIVCGEDGVLWRRMAEHGYKFQYLPEATFYYHAHTNNQNQMLHEPVMLEGRHLIGEASNDGQKNGQELDLAWRESMEDRHGENWKEVVSKGGTK